jgi:CheY-like chemotaxis protein
VQLLQPLGFELRTAASGHDALDLLAAGYVPDAVFMDLAMPGIDGWETVRRLRAAGHSQARVAIVSANAFDKGLDNDVGIAPEDFLVGAPQRAARLAGAPLALQWAPAPGAAGAEPTAPAPPAPPGRCRPRRPRRSGGGPRRSGCRPCSTRSAWAITAAS